jgi:N-formylglutamate amidohydrolase
MVAPAYRRLGPETPETPVVLSVGHAGRRYPEAIEQRARLSVGALTALEDAHADRLVDDAVAEGATAIVADVARAWIDLNRDPRELDPGMVDPRPAGGPMAEGPRVRAGLGLVPRRVSGGGDIWRGPITAADVAERLAEVHEPYHAAVAETLAAARERHGHAVLLDCHSMPPLSGQAGGVRVVVGDLGGASADHGLVATTLGFLRAQGFRTAHNVPMRAAIRSRATAGRRSASMPVQLEICRSLYLDPPLRSPGPGLNRMRRLIAELHRTLAARPSGADGGRVSPA